MLNKHISNLIQTAITNGFIGEEDKYYVANKVISHLGVNEFEFVKYVDDHIASINYITDFAVENNLVEDNITERDIFESKFMDSFIPMPSTINEKIKSFEKESDGLDWLFEMNKFSNYIKTERTSKNIEYTKEVDGTTLNITFNNSKPEKTPAEIAAAAKVSHSSYPETILAKDNVGFAGVGAKQARSTHRIYPMKLNNEKWYFQNSPYQYFDRHSIILTDEIVPMNITCDTFRAMLDFVKKNNSYKVGANADIPIVGGSILYHNHYQAGVTHFPIENSKEQEIITIGTTKISFTDWLVGSIVIEDTEPSKICDIAGSISKWWKEYKSNTDLLLNDGNNTISSFAKKDGDSFKLYLLFRNNSVSEDRPDGIYHVPHHIQAIKGENIGIIEAIGIAILPGRLPGELENLDAQTGDKWDAWKEWIGKKMDMSKFDSDEAVAISFHEILKEVSVFNKSEDIKQDIEEYIKTL